MRNGVLCVKHLPSQDQRISMMPGFRIEQQCSPAVNSIDSSSRLLDSGPCPGCVTLGKSHTFSLLQCSLLKMETVIVSIL